MTEVRIYTSNLVIRNTESKSNIYKAFLRDNFHTGDTKIEIGEVHLKPTYNVRIVPKYRGKGLGRELTLSTLDYYCHHSDTSIVPVAEHHPFFDHLGLSECTDEPAYDMDGRFAALMGAFRSACESDYAASVAKCSEELGAASTIQDRDLPLIYESRWVTSDEQDVFDRPLYLTHSAAKAWRKMRESAASDSVILQAISGFRDWHYQKLLVEKKLAAGQSTDDIFAVSAPPGYSEHHSGCALDLGTEGSEPLAETFEETEAFAWLANNASEFGFRLSYPQNNDLGFAYEPWHWMYLGKHSKDAS